MTDRDDLATMISARLRLGLTARTSGQIADAVLAAGWVPAERLAEAEKATEQTEHVYDQLSDEFSVLHDEWDDLRTTIDRVRALCELPDPDNSAAMQPYAVDLSDGVHLAVLVDDLRAALDGKEVPR